MPSMFDWASTQLELPKVLAHLSTLAVSEAGQAACLALRPLTDLETIRSHASWYVQIRTWKARTGYILAPFLSLDGILELLDAPSAQLDQDALWGLRRSLLPARELVTSFISTEAAVPEEDWPLLVNRVRSFLFPHQSVTALTRCLADDGRLRDEASPELSLARSGIRSLHQTCTRRVKDFVQQHGLEPYLQDDFMTLSSDRYVLPLKANFKGRFDGVIHDYSQTGETCYFEPIFLMEVNNRLQELKRAEHEAEIKVIRYLTDCIRGELAGVRDAYALMVDADVALAVAALAAGYDGAIVEFGDSLPVRLYNAKHPLLFLQHAASPKTAPSPVPVNLLLNEGQKALIVSGGNAGGKTVSLKTLGLTALMGMCGLPVPVSPGGTLPFWQEMLVFIGDGQSIEDHVSTFTAQIRNLSQAWKTIDSRTLVILDEFGAGTDPSQGAALAQAVIDGLLDCGAYVIAATHFPALKAYALSREGVCAASVLFDPKSKKPLYRLAYNQVGASQALEVAKEHGLPESVLRRAEQYLLIDGVDTTSLIERLNAVAVEREREIHLLEAERIALRDKRKTLEEKFAKEREVLFASIQNQAQAVLRDWKTSRITHKQALKELSKTRKSLLEATECGKTGEAPASVCDISQLSPGMTVHYTVWDKSGRILELDVRRGRARLDLSGITIWAEADKLLPMVASVKSEAAQHVPAHRYMGQKIETVTSLRLDLRGMRADVALMELERFLDAAIVNGRSEVDILHGRGTGALRRQVHAHLKRHPSIVSFAVAPEDQGGDGVTCVVLK